MSGAGSDRPSTPSTPLIALHAELPDTPARFLMGMGLCSACRAGTRWQELLDHAHLW